MRMFGLQANETNDKNQNIPHDLHNITYPVLELAVKDTSVLLSTLQNYYCPIDQWGVAVAGATGLLNARRWEAVTVPLFFRFPSITILTPTPAPLGSLDTLPRSRSLLQTKMAAVPSKRTGLENPTEK